MVLSSRFYICLGILLLSVSLSFCLKSTFNDQTQFHQTDQVHGPGPLNEEATGQFGQPTHSDSKTIRRSQSNGNPMKSKSLQHEPLIDTAALKDNLENLKDDVRETVQTIVQDAPQTPARDQKAARETPKKPLIDTEHLGEQFQNLKGNIQEKMENAAKIIPTAALKEKLQSLKETAQEKVQASQKVDHADKESDPWIDTAAMKEKLQNFKENIQETIQTVVQNAPNAATFLPPTVDDAQNLSSETSMSKPDDNKKNQPLIDTDSLKEKVQDFKDTVQEKIQNIVQDSSKPKPSIPSETPIPLPAGSGTPLVDQPGSHDNPNVDQHKSQPDSDKTPDDEQKTEPSLKEKLQHFKEQIQEKIENIVHHKFSSKEEMEIDEKESL